MNKVTYFLYFLIFGTLFSISCGVKTNSLPEKADRTYVNGIQGDFGDQDLDSVVEKNKKAGEEFLLVNRLNPDVVETSSGLQYEIIRKGIGASPAVDSKVKVNFVASLLDGSVVEDGENEILAVKGQSKGVSEGIQLMGEGSEFRFFVPYQLGNDTKEWKSNYLPYSVLIWEIELVKIEK